LMWWMSIPRWHIWSSVRPMHRLTDFISPEIFKFWKILKFLLPFRLFKLRVCFCCIRTAHRLMRRGILVLFLGLHGSETWGLTSREQMKYVIVGFPPPPVLSHCLLAKKNLFFSLWVCHM
jgi:hypothetical protein